MMCFASFNASHQRRFSPPGLTTTYRKQVSERLPPALRATPLYEGGFYPRVRVAIPPPSLREVAAQPPEGVKGRRVAPGGFFIFWLPNNQTITNV